ncbi:MAG: T9SS type A sorting domain-containing protein [Cyclobacteriaceae bacterium]|nr:T9SS type A sorting domain-containing protein [Cyclobacteriaceae bacterium]
MRYWQLVTLNFFFVATILWCVHEPRKPERSQAMAVAEQYSGPEEFARFHKEIRTAAGESTPAYQPGYRLKEYRKALTAARNRPPQLQSGTITWTERGPSNVPGRTRGLIVDPDDPLKNTWYAGSAGGGVWKTTNAGVNWSLITPTLTNMATTVLAMAASNHNVVYVGTGEGFGNLDGITGNGIFKSNDRGQTWTHLGATSSFSDINRLVVSPTDPNIVVAATQTGIYRSTNGGTSWTKVFDDVSIQDLKANPSNFLIQYAAQYQVGVLKSIDGGVTWALSNAGMSPNGRVEIAVSPVNPNRIFASVEGNLSGGGSDLYLSQDAGVTWSLVNVVFNNQPLNFLGNQGWYDNTIACDPFDANVVYFGGVNLFRLTLGTGTTEVANYDFQENGTSGFLYLLSFQNITYSSARLTAGPQAGQRNVELRFGPGKSQKAHRFTVPLGSTSGVPSANYTYANYVDVPFEVWEVTNPLSPRQIMVSFRDQANNGQFDLMEQFFGADPLLNSREYVFINDVDYATTPNPSIALPGGHEFRLMYSFFPALANGATWQPASLPTSTLVIKYTGLPKFNAATVTVSDAYNQYDGKNRFLAYGLDVHPDQHNLVMVPMTGSTFKIINASDGGVFVSNTSTSPGTNQGDWTMAGRSYRTSQFYGADKRPGFDQYVGGTQDNGTWMSPVTGSSTANTEYNSCFGGDGFEVIWNNLDDQHIIGGSQGNTFFRSQNGGLSWDQSTAGLFGTHPFISKLANSRDNPDRIYTLSSVGVFYSEDFGGLWRVAPITAKWGGSSALMDIEVSRANANIVWAGSGMIESAPMNLHVSTDAGVTFTPTVNPPSSLISGGITKLASHPFQEQTAYALFSQAGNPKILRTTDLGQTWEDISGFESGDVSTRGFPDVAVYCLYVRPDNPDILWAGTEIGIVESVDNGLTWSLIPDFPALSVWDMKGMDNQVVIATHGRGIWTATIDVSQETVVHPEILEWGTSPKKELVLRVRLAENFDKVEFYNGPSLVGVSNAATPGDWVVALPGVSPGPRTVKMIGYHGTAPIHSKSYSLDQLNILSIENSYATYFGDSEDFKGNGFALGSFTNSMPSERKILHSDHPYIINTNSTAILLHPVVVSATHPFLYYEDVALVEPGDNGAPFGTTGFKDYVVMEASTNGLDWIALEDGYDARAYPEWGAAYLAGAAGSRSLLRQHQVNLTNQFQVGDTLLFRYRLYADGTVTGWGAAVDYITIQEEPTGIEPTRPAVESFKAFPNPVATEFTASYTVKSPTAVMLEVIDLSGRRIHNKELMHNAPGTFEETFSMRGQPAGTYFVRLKSPSGEQVLKIVVSR